MAQINDWLSEEEAAQWLAIPVDVIRQAMRRGELPVLRVGSFTRISKVALLDAARTGGVQLGAGAEGEAGRQHGEPDEHTVPAMGFDVPQPLGLEWINELQPHDAFTYHWPSGEDVRYEPSYEGSVKLYGQTFRVRVGQFSSANRDTRSRLAVLFNGTPICEFVETADHAGWAGLIKPDGKSVLRASDIVPSLYANSRVQPYREATDLPARPGVSTGQCVVFAQDDIRSAVHHAAARWLGKHQHPLVPQR